jgi:uncharacterized protein (DUF2141 family)
MRAAALLLLLTLAARPALAEPGVLEVTVTGVRSAAGHVLVAICDKATFLQPTCAYRGRSAAVEGSVVVRITGIPPGTYAAEAYQDENDNNKIDRNVLGIPAEGIGFSNNARMLFGPPAFSEAAFVLTPAGGAINFSLRYLN